MKRFILAAVAIGAAAFGPAMVPARAAPAIQSVPIEASQPLVTKAHSARWFYARRFARPYRIYGWHRPYRLYRPYAVYHRPWWHRPVYYRPAFYGRPYWHRRHWRAYGWHRGWHRW